MKWTSVVNIVNTGLETATILILAVLAAEVVSQGTIRSEVEIPLLRVRVRNLRVRSPSRTQPSKQFFLVTRLITTELDPHCHFRVSLAATR